MKILLIRQAAAVPHGTPGVLDAERPLTSSARVEFTTAARGIARLLGQIDVLLTSPLARARETAEIAADALPPVRPVSEPMLAGDSVDAIMSAVAAHPSAETIALVGHAPVLGAVLARMLKSAEPLPLTFKRGGAALVDLPDGPGTTGRLVWFVPPRVLRAVADSLETVTPSTTLNGGKATSPRAGSPPR